MKYAEHTDVPVERSKAELERILRRYGATEILIGWAKEKHALLAFRMADRPIKLRVPMPDTGALSRTATGKRRGRDDLASAVEQCERQRWRALVLLCKAKLEACEIGLEDIDTAWLPYIVAPNGRTIGETLLPQLQEILAGGQLPPLLPEHY